MKKLHLTQVVSALAIMLFFLYSCSKEKSTNPGSTNSGNVSIAAKGSVKSTSSFGDYTIAVSVSTDGKVWTYTITPKKGAKNLSHLIFDLNNCGDQSATFADIVSATLNGQPADINPTEGWGTGCDPQATTTNFVKIGFTPLVSPYTYWTLVVTYDRGYETFATAIGWLKAGTSCNQGTIPAPGCPKTDYCSYSQGFFFAAGSYTNGATEFWKDGLTIGGITYTQDQCTNFWAIDRGKGGDQTMNAFFQLGAIRLSADEAAVSADAAIIEAYFTGLNVASYITTGTLGGNTYQYFNLPAINNLVSKADAVAAGSRIGQYIDTHHCQ